MTLVRQVGEWVWRWLVPQRSSFYDRQLLVLALTLMLVGMLMVASASITEGVSLRNDGFYFLKRHLLFIALCLFCAGVTLYIPLSRWEQWGGASTSLLHLSALHRSGRRA